MRNPTIGILALQGGFAAHRQMLERLGAQVIEVRAVEQLSSIRGLVFPGGESTTILKLLEPQLKTALIREIRAGMPVLATCAGTIVLAREVQDPHQESLDLLDISVSRNAYGRQCDSFETDTLELTQRGLQLLETEQFEPSGLPRFGITDRRMSGIFIRAPRITRVGSDVQTLLEFEGEPVAVAFHNILAATFHPELLEGLSIFHELFLRKAECGIEARHERQIALL